MSLSQYYPSLRLDNPAEPAEPTHQSTQRDEQKRTSGIIWNIITISIAISISPNTNRSHNKQSYFLVEKWLETVSPEAFASNHQLMLGGFFAYLVVVILGLLWSCKKVISQYRCYSII